MTMEGELESEKALLLNKDMDQGWPAWRVMIVTATTCFYATGIMPVAIFAPLMPALEEDVSLRWNAVHSGLAISMYTLFEAMGLLFLGWLSDVYGGPVMLVLSQLGISIILGMLTRQSNPVAIIGLVAMIAFVRGIVWPAATKSMNMYLSARQWEVGLCLIGLASRSGDFLTSEVLGLLEAYCGWRSAVGWIAGITGTAVVIFQLIISKVEKIREDAGALAPFEVKPAGAQTSMAPRWDNLKAFYSETDTWLLLLLVTFLQLLVVWGSYVAAFARSIYGVSASNSALTNGSFAFGQAVSLFGTLMLALSWGNRRRDIYVASTVACIVVSIVPILFLVSEVSFTFYIVFPATIGIAVGTVYYVPVAVYCMHVSRRTGGYALYCSSLYSVSYVVSALTSYMYGHVRKVSEQLAFQLDMTLATICLLVCSFSMALHIRRNWDGALFETEKASESRDGDRP